MILVTIAVVVMTAVSTRVSAQEIAIEDTLINEEVLAADTMVNNDPEWYVAPVDRAIIRAPKRAAAGTCPIDSIQTYDANGNLAEVVVYEYGDTTRTIFWIVNPDGSRVGQSKEEAGSNGNVTFSATYSWDYNANTWMGVSKTENEYAGGKEILRHTYDWINGAWVVSRQYTWAYDAGREVEFLLYVRNTTTNQLVLTSGRVTEWYGASTTKKTSDIQYDAHDGITWSAGTKTEYAYDANGNTTEKIYYSSISNGNWVGSTHETWEYVGSNKTHYEKQIWKNGEWANSLKEIWAFGAYGQTLHEKYGWSNGDWLISLREIKGYNENGKNNLIENYSFTNGNPKGTKKLEYIYAGSAKIETITYKWKDNAFVKSARDVNNTVSNPTETCGYYWDNDDWVGTGNRILTTKTGGKETEKVTQIWSTDANAWVNSKRATTAYEGNNIVQEASYIWFGDNWIGSTRTDHHYTGGKEDTIKTYTNNGVEWIYSQRTIKTYSGSTLIRTHISNWDVTESKWVLESMTRTDIINEGGNELLKATWHCGSDSIWIGDQKDTAYYVGNNKTYEAHYSLWANNDWVPFCKLDYEYNEDNQLTLQQRFNWNAGEWVGGYRYENGYDEQGRQILAATYSGWDKTSKEWIGDTKLEQTYGDNGKIATELSYVWGTDDWRRVFRYVYTYDNQGREIEHTTEHYENEMWLYTNKYIKEYKGSTIVKNNTYLWLNNQWVFSSRYEDYYDDDAQAKLRHHINGSWSNGQISSYDEKLYFYACDLPVFTIRFEDEDGTLLATKQVAEGQVPSYGETPTKVADTQHEYTFTNWSPEVVAATGDATYTAIYTATTRKYMITWLNDDNTQIDQTEVEYGVVPTHANPIKENTAEYSYEFTGWDVTPVAVTGVATYKATFSATKNKYMITWLNDDDTQIDQTEVEYGVVPTHADPTKENTPEWMYEFTGWDVEPVAVTGVATYKATFSATKNKYMITWLNDDDTQIDQTEVEYGVVPTHANPTKENTAEYSYEFTGWDVTPVAVTGVATYKATFSATKNKYMITWLNDDDTQIDQTEVEYGVVPTHADPTKENTAEWTYEFTGWDVTPAAVTGTATYKATFSATKNKYMITWLNDDDTQIDQTEVEYGVVPTHANPTKENTAEYSYEFTGWDVTPVAVTGVATYKATFSATKNKYMITWLNDDNSQIDQTEVEYGVVPTHADPTKENTPEYSYEFTGWDVTPVAVTGTATYKATFSATKNKYMITWLNEDGSMIDQAEVEYGNTPAHANIYKENTAQYTYTFTGWSPEIVSVTGEATYKAQFDSVINKYMVTFYFDDGVTVIKSMEVAYGEVPSIAITPSRVAEEHYYYVFAGWSPELTEVTGDVSYTAIFNKVPKEYEILFKDWNGTQLLKANVAYGTMPEYTGATPERKGNAQYSYTFTGWSPELTEVTGNATYTAVYEAVVNMYTVRFLDEDGTELENQLVAYGVVPVYQGETPTKEDDEEYRYIFAGWSPRVTAVTSDAAYYATYTAHKKAEGFESITDHQSPITNKIMIDGRIYIIRGGHTYTTDGTMVE